MKSNAYQHLGFTLQQLAYLRNATQTHFFSITKVRDAITGFGAILFVPLLHRLSVFGKNFVISQCPDSMRGITTKSDYDAGRAGNLAAQYSIGQPGSKIPEQIYRYGTAGDSLNGELYKERVILWNELCISLIDLLHFADFSPRLVSHQTIFYHFPSF